MDRQSLVSRIEEILRAKNITWKNVDLRDSIGIGIDGLVYFDVTDNGFTILIDSEERKSLVERPDVEAVIKNSKPLINQLLVKVTALGENIEFWVNKGLEYRIEGNTQSGSTDDNYPSEELLQKTYDARDQAWEKVGTVDKYVLGHLVNPSFMGEPDWPNLRRGYKIIHLENGNTIIATDGLSDPFMKDHQFYDAAKNGFGMELYIEITEPFDIGKAGYSWWFETLAQMSFQAIHFGNILEAIQENGGTISTELPRVPIPEQYTFEGRTPVLLGVPSNKVPAQVAGPLSPIHFVSVMLLTLDELHYVVEHHKEGRQYISEEIVKQQGEPISSLERQSVVHLSETKRHVTPIDQTPQTLPVYNDFRNLQDSDVHLLSEMLGVSINSEAVAAWRAKYPDEPLIFIELAMDEYSPELARRLVGDDHKWDDLQIFNGIKEAAPELQLDYPHDGAKFEEEQWTFTFAALGRQHTVTTSPLDIFPIFDYINSLLAAFNKKFIFLDDFGDGLHFLLVNTSVDEKKLRDIIYTVSEPTKPVDHASSKMLTIDAGEGGKELSKEGIGTLATLLGTTFVGVDDFLAKNKEPHEFYEFFFDVMIEHDTCAMDVDWKWDPEDIFWWLGKLLPDYQIKLTKNEAKYEGDAQYPTYDIEFTFDGSIESLKVKFENPEDLMKVVNRHLADKQFIDVWFGQDSYSWLLAPINIDVQAFKEATGLVVTDTKERTRSNSSVVEIPPVSTISNGGQEEQVGGLIDLQFKQSWLEKSTETALEEFKSAFADYLNTQYSDRHASDRWSITKTSEGELAHLIYDEQPIATFKVEQAVLRFTSNDKNIVRYDDLMYAARLIALRLGLAVYSMAHGGARLPATATLALDHTYFKRNNEFAKFFEKGNFAPRYCVERYEERDDGGVITVNPPYYLEDKNTGAIHIVNYPMLDYLVQKDNQQTNEEFSYKVADSMNDFAKKYDFALVPVSFYKNYRKPVKIINDTDFDIDHINRKVFIDPYVWDFDADHDPKYYSNVKNGMHYMDKVRKDEDLNTAVKRVLREELKVADDYVGARIWGIDFDRDRDGFLTPRLKMNIFVRGMVDKQRSKDHDWVSVK